MERFTLPACHYERSNWHNESIDLITVGDSFSNGMGSGINPYYQDYLATSLHINVLNIQNLNKSFSYIDTIRYLHKTKWLHKVHPRAILIECVVRESMNHIPSNPAKIDLAKENFNPLPLKTNFIREFPLPMLINTANYKAPYYHFAYHYNIQAKKEIYKFPLLRPLFTTKDMNHLLIYHDDINNISQFTEKKLIKLNKELNTLANELHQDGIILIFMPAVDKYDLYHHYVANNRQYPKNPFFSILRKQPKKYLLVDTKAILHPLLEANISDVYYADDTHWSFKASERISHDSIFTFLKHKD
jgi:hypothetical protein